ncbi:hypothetical protein JTB14_036640 [Gonioctena quinquepunctata]|nr:hypothetical protein JTB14_036640 [Gonioctena quinquepunctata]
MKAIFLLLCAVAYIAAEPAGTCPHKNPEYPVYLADTVYCAKFYECSNGNPYPFVCPHGTYWNSTLTSCDDNVECGILITTPSG